MKTIRHRVFAVLPAAVTFAALVAIWQVAVRMNDVSPLVLPAPSAIWQNVTTHFGAYAHDGRVTLFEAMAGLMLATVVSCVLAVLMVHYRIIRRAVDPLAIALRCLPVVALAPGLALWLGFGATPKVIVAALITFPPLLVNLVTGLRSVDESMLEVLESVNASRWEILLRLRAPHALPYLFSALKVCTTLALIGAVVAEWSASSEGLGYRIIRAQNDLATTTVWGAIAVLAALGIALTLVVNVIEHQSLRRLTDQEH